jgi:hypothetical protein
VSTAISVNHWFVVMDVLKPFMSLPHLISLTSNFSIP